MNSNVDCEEQCLAKTWIFLTPYVCTERIFDSRPFASNKIFLKKVSLKLVAHIFTLLLALGGQLYESLKNVWKRSNRCFRRKMSPISNFPESLKSHYASNDWPIWTQKVICEVPTAIIVFFKKSLLYLIGRIGRLSKIRLFHTYGVR